MSALWGNGDCPTDLDPVDCSRRHLGGTRKVGNRHSCHRCAAESRRPSRMRVDTSAGIAFPILLLARMNYHGKAPQNAEGHSRFDDQIWRLGRSLPCAVATPGKTAVAWPCRRGRLALNRYRGRDVTRSSNPLEDRTRTEYPQWDRCQSPPSLCARRK